MKTFARQSDTAGQIQMIYVDPPFFTGADYDAVVEVNGQRLRHPAYRDTWSSGLKEYLICLSESLLLMRELLAEDGLLWMHLDWHASHYARVLMDEILGEKNFVNEIVWEYKSGGSTKKRFARKHDSILVYSKGKSFKFHPLKEKSYNRGLKPYRFKGVEEFCDEVGWYTLVNMKDVWQLDMVGRTSAERTGYATQKPMKLMERIISCCTDPGDLVADLFCGSGTLGASAARMGRRSLQCDAESLAVEHSLARILAMEQSVWVYKPSITQQEHAFLPVLHVGDKGSLREITLDTLHDFRPPEGMDRKSAALLEEVLAQDSLDMVACWSVDQAYDGEVFRPTFVMRRDRNGLVTCCETDASPGGIMVKIVDVMGRGEYCRL
jgi:DNA modification methylase